MSEQNRRTFLGTAAATTAAFTIVPRHVLGGPGVVAPSDKITLAYIGVGTQGLREMLTLLPVPDIQIVAVCDPNKYAVNYRDWSRDGILNGIRQTIGKPDWKAGAEGAIPGGRDVGKDVVESYYAANRASDKYKGCAAYADYRELLEKEKDLNAVKVMTPDHLHGVISMAAMKKGKHVMMHKPIANRLKEARQVIQTARETGVSTHFIPWDTNGSMDQVMAWIKDGSIGTLREVHNWTNRPVWPQYATLPTDKPSVPEGFDWDLWLGPEAERPYHPDYTNMVFRGWYDFGGGSMADMGHYSLWTVFNALDLTTPTSVDPMLSHDVVFNANGNVPMTVRNDFSFPTASVTRFKYPARGARPAIDLIWYDGGIKPPTPEELDEDHKTLPAEGMMFVGDKGKILAGFRVENPRLIPERLMQARGYPPPQPPARQQRESGEVAPGIRQWIAACRGARQQSPGSFLNAGPISDAVNLYAVALRARQRVLFDAENVKITNSADADKYLAREYRKGWSPA
ncbi:MAG TPA: Gfo/Idh/MocA family oxidoreductase [Bryobacteraceae bacterium]|nr:Gfo/Idh/MocA family oxidoreductase [Bryobacteraceae bacterium]